MILLVTIITGVGNMNMIVVMLYGCDFHHSVFINQVLILLLNIIMATIQMTTQDFKDKVFNYEKEADWKYQGTLPAIIDFYADWCGPCKMVAPILEELSKDYEGKIIVYKVDTDAEQELSAVFGIQSIPTLLFIGADGEPMMQPGALPKHVLKQVIEEKMISKVKNEDAL